MSKRQPKNTREVALNEEQQREALDALTEMGDAEEAMGIAVDAAMQAYSAAKTRAWDRIAVVAGFTDVAESRLKGVAISVNVHAKKLIIDEYDESTLPPSPTEIELSQDA